MSKRTIGREAGNGRFMSVADAMEYRTTAVVETIDVPSRRKARNTRRRRAVRQGSASTKGDRAKKR